MNSTDERIKMTPTAVAEVKRLIAENKLPDTAGVRVGIRGGGCSGATSE